MDHAAALAPLVAVAVPATYVVAVCAIALEALALALVRVRVNHREALASLGSGGLAFGLMHVANLCLYLSVLERAWAHRVMDAGLGPMAWLGCFVLYDLSFYLGHRAGHEVRLLWCFHSVHHTAEQMRLTSAIRGSALDFVYLPWFFAWIPLLGFHPAMLLVVESFSRTWGVLTHVSPALLASRPEGLAGRVLAGLARLLVTPSAHRVHHGKEQDYLDRNYGEVLVLWDRLLGTHAEEGAAPTYGVLSPVDAGSLRDVQCAPWIALWRDVRRAPSWGARLRYLFDAPGWSHDGPDHRVRTQRAAGRGAAPVREGG
jgi:sterol desaturase/sphingolipid hydroxylase (fatty acid hydroxylase superfamily)